jgi:hypothetical protein
MVADWLRLQVFRAWVLINVIVFPEIPNNLVNLVESGSATVDVSCLRNQHLNDRIEVNG